MAKAEKTVETGEVGTPEEFQVYFSEKDKDEKISVYSQSVNNLGSCKGFKKRTRDGQDINLFNGRYLPSEEAIQAFKDLKNSVRTAEQVFPEQVVHYDQKGGNFVYQQKEQGRPGLGFVIGRRSPAFDGKAEILEEKVKPDSQAQELSTSKDGEDILMEYLTEEEPDSKEDSGVLDLTKEEDSQADIIPLEEPKPDSQK
jgi:hypothetical protein|tara:strand:- start:266 stop:862 length:597 start_codon:yes stop_codon:yes gene_type:complete